MATYTQRAAKSVSIILIMAMATGFLAYIVRLVLARNLTVEEYGLFYSVFSFLALIGAFKGLGVDYALLRFVPAFKAKKQLGKLKNSIMYAIVLQIAANLIIIGVIFMLAQYLSQHFFKDPAAVFVLQVMVIAFFVDSIVTVLKYVINGFQRMFYFASIDFVRMLLIMGIVMIGFSLGHGMLSALVAYLLTPLILVVVYGQLLLRRVFPAFSDYAFSYDKKLSKELFGYGVIMLASSIGMVIITYTDSILLTYFSGLRNVGLYNVALPTATLLIFFPRAIGQVLLPMSSELWEKKKHKILSAGIESLYKYSAIIIVPASLAMIFFADLIISIFFGSSYADAGITLSILSLAAIFITINVVNTNFIAGIGKAAVNNKIIYSGALINLVLNLVLIPKWGIEGAAVASAASYAIMATYGILAMKNLITVTLPIGAWIKTTAAGIVFILCMASIKRLMVANVWVETALVVAVAGFVYLALLFILKIVTVAEIKDLMKRTISRS